MANLGGSFLKCDAPASFPSACSCHRKAGLSAKLLSGEQSLFHTTAFKPAADPTGGFCSATAAGLEPSEPTRGSWPPSLRRILISNVITVLMTSFFTFSKHIWAGRAVMVIVSETEVLVHQGF